MAGADQIKGRICAHSGLEGLQLQRKPCFRQQDVDFQHGLVAVLKLRFNGGYLCGKGHQNALDLLRFLCAVLQDAGIGFHHSLRLHKHRSALPTRQTLMWSRCRLTFPRPVWRCAFWTPVQTMPT